LTGTLPVSISWNRSPYFRRTAHIPPQKRSNSSTLVIVVCTAGIIAALHYGADLIVPFALAVLVSFLLNYPVTWVERLKIGHAASVIVVMLVAFSLAGTMVWIAGSQMMQIIIRLPEYQQNIRTKLDRIQHLGGSNGNSNSGFAKAAQSITELVDEFSATNQAVKQAKSSGRQPAQTVPNPGNQALPVRVVKPSSGMFGALGAVGAPIARAAATAAAIVVLTLFMLLNRSALRNRLFRLFGRGRINAMTTALDDAASRVSRYLLTQGMVNSTYGLLLGLGLYFIGLPYAAFWGFSAVFLRFIPYVGTFVAGMSPFVLSLAVFDGWKQPLECLGLFVVVEGSISAFLEPWLYATRTGISSLAILVSATFWTLLWGPIGLVMSTPLTVLLVVIGRHVPQLDFLYVLLGDEPVLPPEAHYYQRLLALDEDEAREVADEFMKGKTTRELYDGVLIPALALSEEDRHNGGLDDERQKFIYQSTRDLIQETSENVQPVMHRLETEIVAANGSIILCIPARDEADELVALMLATSLRDSGYDARSIPIGFVEEMLDNVKQCQPTILFISALPPFAITHARSLCRRAREICGEVKVVIGLWGSTMDRKMLQRRLGAGCSEYLVHSITEAELQVRLFLGNTPEAPAPPVEKPGAATSPQLTESIK
jgi:predicted PurR-regulated permease PerM/CheY-like chemotaxis protein